MSHYWGSNHLRPYVVLVSYELTKLESQQRTKLFHDHMCNEVKNDFTFAKKRGSPVRVRVFSFTRVGRKSAQEHLSPSAIPAIL